LKRLSIASKKAVLFLTASVATIPTIAYGQELTPNPNEWRSVVYSDLQLPGPAERTYVSLWADLIATNNAAYKAAGDIRYAAGNAPATESHFVVRSPEKVVVLSVLNTATNCSVIRSDELGKTTLKRCPMRLAVFRGDELAVSDAGNGCFLEFAQGQFTPDPARSASYAAYDVDNRTIRTGVIFAKDAIDECVQKIPIP